MPTTTTTNSDRFMIAALRVRQQSAVVTNVPYVVIRKGPALATYLVSTCRDTARHTSCSPDVDVIIAN